MMERAVGRCAGCRGGTIGPESVACNFRVVMAVTPDSTMIAALAVTAWMLVALAMATNGPPSARLGVPSRAKASSARHGYQSSQPIVSQSESSSEARSSGLSIGSSLSSNLFSSPGYEPLTPRLPRSPRVASSPSFKLLSTFHLWSTGGVTSDARVASSSSNIEAALVTGVASLMTPLSPLFCRDRMCVSSSSASSWT